MWDGVGWVNLVSARVSPAPLGCDHLRMSVLTGIDRDFASYDYTDAKVNSVFLNMYNWVRQLHKIFPPE